MAAAEVIASVMGARAVALVLIGMLAACGMSSAAPTGPASADPSATGSGVAERCPDIDLRTPAGDEIDLDGAWATEKEGLRGGIYYFRQVGTCFWFVGGFSGPDDTDIEEAGPLSYLTTVFHGAIANDFTIRGEWIDARTQFQLGSSGPGGTMTLRIVIDDSGVVHVEYVGGTGQPFVEPGYREEQSWIKISDGGAYPPPAP